jgi:UDP-glucose 4-epimerase
MNTICITGISGYLGVRLAKALKPPAGKGELIGIDIAPPPEALKNISFYQKDIRDPGVEAVFSQHQVDTVFHLAFVVKPIHRLKKMHDIDYNGTQNILEAAHRAGVKHLIAVSSTLAYGAHPDNPKRLSEDAPLRGNNAFPYGYEKALTDRMIQEFAAGHENMTITILRPCTVFGPHVNNYVSRMLFLPATVCVRGYDPPVQFVHEVDFVHACLLAAEKRLPGAFNICGDGTLTISRIASVLGTRLVPLPAAILYPVLEALWRVRFPKIEVNRGYLDYIRYPFVAANKKAKKQLHFYPRYSSLQTLKDTVRTQKGDPAEKKRKAV